MATETADEAAEHRRSVTIAAIITLAGVAAGVVSQAVAAGPTDRVGVVALVGGLAVALGVVQAVGYDVTEFSKKDALYVAFMTGSMWFVTWTVLLTSGTTL